MKSDASRPAIFDYFNVLHLVDKVSLEGPDAKTKRSGPARSRWSSGCRAITSRTRATRTIGEATTRTLTESWSMSCATSRRCRPRPEGARKTRSTGRPLNEFLRFKSDPNFQCHRFPAAATRYGDGCQLPVSAHRQQAGAPGTELRHRTVNGSCDPILRASCGRSRCRGTRTASPTSRPKRTTTRSISTKPKPC